MEGGAVHSTKKLTIEKIARLVKKLSAENLKTKSPSIQYSKRTKPKTVSMVSVKGGAFPNTKKLINEKIASLVKKPSIEKPKTKSPSI